MTGDRGDARAGADLTTCGGEPDLATLGSLQDAFLAAVPAVPPDTRVPWCGRWRVRHLVVHLARIHHWAAGQARRSQETPLGRGPFVLDELYGAQARELRETLAALDPDAPAWTLDDSRVVRFWHRRQVHETLVHLWDLRTAGGLPLDVPAALWADTVDEVVRVMHPRQVRLGRVGAPDRRIGLAATDVGRAWTVHAADDAPAAPVVEVAGPAGALALLLWGRTTCDDPRLAVTGDRGTLEAALAPGLTP
ncbi:maleylpyruvate isomerase family mycothiol-dependent enzyme [Cellulomonas wangsupingiae]|uniref:Maleylpyruvate isomerase family mycothiol-dependent enzyme n=1 Tax=Cellulomonas wangsupingiae TaxID=2968085 RepID=A0ABY5K0M6_9CELL|nr:maleylpyruvate isomerase family mycothiol-dependent enzyme [Cellulomonas wangsupingiae]MCC2336612.1 maleylpyruvate isomerase family mycothiol-dependent enzyme [Cellulomonas wangsupingiae]UUI63794.1 maleylpyruvate isomerase family mycothiol-dependent enzyme [Cellulomonas wangsupingiae]